MKRQNHSVWTLAPGQGVRPGKAQLILILLWSIIAVLLGELGTFSIPFIEQASLFWPAMVFQTVGGLWFGGLGILSAVLFPLFSNVLGGFPWPQNLAWISGNLIQGGLVRFWFQYRGWDPSLPSGREIWAFIGIGAVLSNILGAALAMGLLRLTPYGLSWSDTWAYCATAVIGNGVPCILLGIPLLKIFSPLITGSSFFFPRLWQVPRSSPMVPVSFRDIPIAVKLLVGFLVGGFFPLAALSALSVSEDENPFNVVLILSLFLCLLLSGYIAGQINTPLNRVKERLRQIGAGDFNREFRIESRDELGRIGDGIQAMALNLARLYAEQEERFLETILSLAEAIDARDPYTRGHSDHVSRYALETARALGLSEEESRSIYYAAILHDVGKIGIREDVLNYDGPLDPEKYAHMKTHPDIGARILGVVKDFEPIRLMVRSHHEQYDGSGYPDGLRGPETPLGARIIAVADVYDALTTDRPYRAAWSKERALEVIREKSGSHFDPRVASAFLSVMRGGGAEMDCRTALPLASEQEKWLSR